MIFVAKQATKMEVRLEPLLAERHILADDLLNLMGVNQSGGGARHPQSPE
jgi:hypothetical protein